MRRPAKLALLTTDEGGPIVMNTTNLSDATCSDELLGDLVDEDPRFGALWLYILAASQPWGRFPANVKLFKARVCPMVDTLTGATLQELVERLIAVGMLTRYVCPWTGSDCIAVVNHGRYNGTGRKYHRMGKPEFGPHPGWEPPEQLVAYLRYVAGGRYESKTLEGESEKFGIDPGLVRDESVQSDSDSGTTDSIRDNAPGLVRDESGINPPRTEDGGLRTEEYNDEGRQDDSANAGSALASPRASRNGKRRTADGKHRTADGKRPADLGGNARATAGYPAGPGLLAGGHEALDARRGRTVPGVRVPTATAAGAADQAREGSVGRRWTTSACHDAAGPVNALRDRVRARRRSRRGGRGARWLHQAQRPAEAGGTRGGAAKTTRTRGLQATEARETEGECAGEWPGRLCRKRNRQCSLRGHRILPNSLLHRARPILPAAH